MNPSINNPHDMFFKTVMQEIDVAKNILLAILPTKILKLIIIDSLQQIDANFVSDELKETFSDVIFTVKLKNGKEAFITFLLEHKSHPDIFTAIQLLYYLATGYYKQYKNDKKLQVIVPLLFYHGKEKWEYKSLDKVFENIPDELKKFIPAFDTVFLDLADFSDNQLEALENSLITAVLMLQKYALKPDELVKKLHLIFSKMNSVKDKRNFFHKIIVYSLQLLDEEKVEKTIKELPVTLKNEVMTAYESLIEKGKNQAKIQTIIKGHNAGIAINLLSNLTDLTEEEIKKIIKEHSSKDLS